MRSSWGNYFVNTIQIQKRHPTPTSGPYPEYIEITILIRKEYTPLRPQILTLKTYEWNWLPKCPPYTVEYFFWDPRG